jgi:catechol 2,3-dioxygenase-like lactoylglutathione lyase family enzyme
MQSEASLVAFVPSLDLDRSERFYVDVLELGVLERTPYALVLDTGGTHLRVTRVPTLTPHPFTVLGWNVADLAGEVARLSDRGVSFTQYEGLEQDAQGIWTAPDGTGVAWFPDPDQNVLSLHAMVADP